jgi:hypothetical protein
VKITSNEAIFCASYIDFKKNIKKFDVLSIKKKWKMLAQPIC